MSGNLLRYAGDPIERDNLLAPAPTWADAADWHGQNLADTWQAMRQPQTWTDAAHQYGNALLMGTTAPGIRAFHGSPADFERFDASKIGTGEGAQAYGRGLYFAEREAVARQYRDNLSGQMSAEDSAAYSAAHNKAMDLHQELTGLQDLMEFHSSKDGQSPYPGWINPDVAAVYQPKIDKLSAERDAAMKQAEHLMMNAPRNPGKMYEVNINADPAKMLDWDKPLTEQTPHVQEAIGKLRERLPDDYWFNHERVPGSMLVGNLRAAARDGVIPNPTGNVDEAAAAALHEAGLPGISYLDANSRTAGEGSRNHVVFDPATIEILRKYGIAGLMAGGGAAAATQGGQPGT